eukprot:15452454-Alexandrium_andersonii.AAC.1
MLVPETTVKPLASLFASLPELRIDPGSCTKEFYSTKDLSEFHGEATNAANGIFNNSLLPRWQTALKIAADKLQSFMPQGDWR